MKHRSFQIPRSCEPRITRRISSPDSVRLPTCKICGDGTTPSSQGTVNGARHRTFKVGSPAQSTPTTKPFDRKAGSHSQSDRRIVSVRSPTGIASLILESAPYGQEAHFVQLNAATRGLEGWPNPNFQQTLARLGTFKPKHLNPGYHQTPLNPAATGYHHTPLRGLYQWTREAMVLMGSDSSFQRSIHGSLSREYLQSLLETVRVQCRCQP